MSIQRYIQQTKLAEIGLEGQEKLLKARILCVGAGGIGVSLLSYLVGAGVGTIGIVDDDLLEETNLHRQVLYQEKHIHKAKAEIAKEQLQKLNMQVTLDAYELRLNAENAEEIIAQYDLVADCSDNFYTRYLVHDTCYRLHKPYVYASAHQFQGHCSFFYGRENPCLHCLFPILPNRAENCQEGGVLGTLPGLLGIIQATEIIKWVTQTGVSLLNRLLCINLLTMEMKNIHLCKNKECSFCVYNQTLTIEAVCRNSFAINAAGLANFLQENPGVLLLDVRTSEEHAQRNLGGRLIPLAELPLRLKELNPLQPILIYCQSGRRSQQAFILLKKVGFKFLYHLENGIESCCDLPSYNLQKGGYFPAFD